MRIWHYELLPYLPDAQFKGQLRELVAVMRSWRDKGTTNHLLINKVMEYQKTELARYYISYEAEWKRRYQTWIDPTYWIEFRNFILAPFEDSDVDRKKSFSDGWHNKEYLRVCMANLYEKHFFGIGKSRITDDEWLRLCEGYQKITGEEYEI